MLAKEKPNDQSVVLFMNLLQQWFPSDPGALPVVVNIVSLLSSLSIPSVPPILPAPLVSQPSIASMLPTIQPTFSSNQLVLSSKIIEPAPFIVPGPPSQSQLLQYASSSIQFVLSSVLPALLTRSHLFQPILSRKPIKCMQSSTKQFSEMQVLIDQ